ncbi:Glyoxylate/hydroxypyruvate reductase B [Lactobacillus helveticus]|nr:Glyoxylate/hydroxypyruvate reductase B [Lactobacillus helveticus]
MKTGVIILNAARGKLANEADIKNALNEGKIYAYATDVVKGEPIASDSPLLQAKNCYITPHIAWAPYETRERLLHMTVELLHMTVDNIKAYLSGDLKNVIN